MDEVKWENIGLICGSDVNIVLRPLCNVSRMWNRRQRDGYVGGRNFCLNKILFSQ